MASLMRELADAATDAQILAILLGARGPKPLTFKRAFFTLHGFEPLPETKGSLGADDDAERGRRRLTYAVIERCRADGLLRHEPHHYRFTLTDTGRDFLAAKGVS